MRLILITQNVIKLLGRIWFRSSNNLARCEKLKLNRSKAGSFKNCLYSFSFMPGIVDAGFYDLSHEGNQRNNSCNIGCDREGIH